MIIKVETWIYLKVEDEGQAEEACHELGRLSHGIGGFPHGEIVDTDVDHYEKVTPEEAKERGLEEGE